MPQLSGNTASVQQAELWLEKISGIFEEDKLNRLDLSGGEVRDLAFYAASQAKAGNYRLFYLRGVQSEFDDHRVVIRMTLRPGIAQDLYFNLSFALSEEQGLPHWDYLELGHIRWPGRVLSWIFQGLILPFLPKEQERFWLALTQSVKQFQIEPERMVLVYRSGEALRRHLKEQAQNVMVGSPEERKVLQLYLDVLLAASVQARGSELPLSHLMTTLFGLAYARSENGSAVKENSRLLRAFAIQLANGQTRQLLAPGMSPVKIDRPIVLRGRVDLSKHFMVSAALAIQLDRETALEIGVSKEKADSKEGGSGFSMVDLLANMAGINFASVATRDEASARKIQQLMLKKNKENVFMPRIDFLPEGISAGAYEDLKRHPTYPALMNKIVKRINELPVSAGI
ncbi:MAG: hypothetical protein ACPG5T_05630 [Endozoicomonas sp.]